MSRMHDERFRDKLLRAYNQRDDVTFDGCLQRIAAMQEELHQHRQGDPMGDLIAANQDEILKMHEEAIKRIRAQAERGRCGEGGGIIIDIISALNHFHPMHAESWKGWPEWS